MPSPSLSALIVVEGPNLAGKTSLIDALLRRFAAENAPVVSAREPGGTPFGEAVRLVLRNPATAAGAFASALAFNAARRELGDRVIKPALAAGTSVILDRYWHSTEIYQIALGAMPKVEVDVLRQLHHMAVPPTLVIFLVPSQEELTRRARLRNDGEVDRFEGNLREREAYLQFAREYTGPALLLSPGTDASPAELAEIAWQEMVRRDIR